MSDELARNLRYLCAEKPSVAQICREIGVNQQQFSKYLTGRAKPSAHNLRRIAQYFGFDDGSLMLPHDQLVQACRTERTTLDPRRTDPLAGVFPGDLAKLRPFLGAYQIFFRAPVAADSIVVNTIFLDERDGVVYSRLIEALKGGPHTRRRWTRCDGKVTYQNGRLFVVDAERRDERALSMHILSRPPRQRNLYLFGSMCFLASLPQRTPYASKVVWKKFDNFRSVRELFATCGVYSEKSLKLDPVIRTYLSPDG